MKVNSVTASRLNSYLSLDQRILKSILSATNRATNDNKTHVDMIFRDSPALDKVLNYLENEGFKISKSYSDKVKVTVGW